MLRQSSIWLMRLTAALLLATMALIVLLGLLGRFWLGGHLDEYRSRIARMVSQQADLEVSIDHLELHWDIVSPELILTGVRLRGHSGQADLTLQRVSVRPALLPLIAGNLEFARLEIRQPMLRAERRQDGRILLAGVLLPLPDEAPGSPFADWLLAQHEIVLNDGNLIWQDQQAGKPPLELPHVQITLQSHGHQHHLQVKADAAAGVLSGGSLSADFHAVDSAHPADWSGQISTRVAQIDIARLRDFVETPAALHSGRGGFLADLVFSGLQVDGIQTDTRLSHVAVTLSPELPPLRFDQLSGHIEYRRIAQGFTLSARQLLAVGPAGVQAVAAQPADVDLQVTRAGGFAKANVLNLGALTGLTESLPVPPELRALLRERAPQGIVQGLAADWQGTPPAHGSYHLQARLTDVSLRASGEQPGVDHLTGMVQADPQGGRLEIDSRALIVTLPQVFAQPLHVDALQARAHWSHRAEGVLIQLEQLQIADADLASRLSGDLTLVDGLPRQCHLRGDIDHGEVSAVWRFLPRVIPKDAHDWIATALRAGTVHQGSFQLSGDLQAFPFARPGSGVFLAHLPIDGGRLDYAPGWPLLTGVHGTVDFNGPALDFHLAEVHQGNLIARDITGRVPDLDADHARLGVHGSVTGPLQAGLQFLLDSPLRKQLGGFATAVQAEGQGALDLALQIPLDHPDDTQVQGALASDGASLKVSGDQVPPISRLHARINFTERKVHSELLEGMLLGSLAHGELDSGPDGIVVLDAHGDAKAEALAAFYGEGRLDFLRGKADWTAHARFAERGPEIEVLGHLPVFGEVANVSVRQSNSGPLRVQASGSVPLRGLVQEWAPALLWAADGKADWNVALQRDRGPDEVSGGAHFRLFGKPVELVLAGHPDALTADLDGGVDLAALRAAHQPVPDWLSGAFGWKAHLDQRPLQPLLRFSSDLRGLRSALPAPFAKLAGEARNLQLQLTHLRGVPQLYLSGGIDQMVGVAALIPAEPKLPVQRVGIRLLGPALLPATDGVQVNGTLPQLDLDVWRAALSAAPAQASATVIDAVGANPAVDPSGTSWLQTLPLQIDLRINAMQFGRFHLEPHEWVARTQPGGWFLQVRGPQIDGEGDWARDGHITARLNRLILDGGEARQRERAEAGSSSVQPSELPDVDLQVQDFHLDGRALGQLNAHGVPNAEGWSLQKFSLQQPHGSLQGTARWLDGDPSGKTLLDVELNAADSGALLKDLGYPQALARGKTQIRAHLGWPGGPEGFEPAHLAGTLDLDSRSGQFLTLEPGVGRLLGLLSLQALPRRITLDFRDIFSQGFAFDAITGHFDIEQGVLRTSNLEMQGPAARVRLRGTASLPAESQDLDVRVSPAIGNGVSVASTVLGGPVAGVAAFALQKLLRDPFDSILTYEYRVTGAWDDPQVESMTHPAATSGRSSPVQASPP